MKIKRDYKYYLSIRKQLEKNHMGRWVVIADEKLKGISDDYEQIKHCGLEYDHRYLFKVGME
jgi:hypothetical protein